MNEKKLIVLGLTFTTLGIILGAMGAHYLETLGIEPEQIKSFVTGTTYMFYNGIGALALAGINNKFNFDMNTQYRFIMYGAILFSGSIFGLVLLPQLGINISRVLGPITPIGGFMLIIGWGSLLARYLATYKK